MSPAADEGEERSHPMAGHVLGRLGIHATEPGDPCGDGMHLHLAPQLLDEDGHVDFGVLGVFLDMACSQAGLQGGFLHADISVHRIDRPRGTKLFVDARVARRGGRSAVVHIDVHDDLGVRVAYSCQQIRIATPRPPAGEDGAAVEVTPEQRAAMHRSFMERFNGECTLPGPLHDSLDLRRVDGEAGPVWTMPLTPSSRTGFGGLHGGVAFSLVGDAAAGGAVAAGFDGAKTTSALLRYLAPGLVGPFRAVPEVMPQADGDAFVRVEVFDEGADDLLIILGEVHVVLPR
jgi:acyl-coenzyme A thioesterase PaaI-like protein